jgi:hypothetical protein
MKTNTVQPGTDAHAAGCLPAGVQLRDLPGLEVGEGIDRLGLTTAQYVTFLRLFRDTKRGAVASIQTHMNRQRWSAAQAEVHGLKGSAGMLMATPLYTAAVNLDGLLKTCRDQEAPVHGVVEGFQQFARAHQELMAGLERLG